MAHFVEADNGQFLPLQLVHGIGSRSDLPVPVTFAQFGAVAVLVLTFVLLGSKWKLPRYAEALGVSMPRVQRVTARASWKVVGAAIGIVSLLAFIVVAAFGADSSNKNPAPTWLYVWLWVGLVPVSVLFGPVVRHFNPYRPIAKALWLLARRDDVREYPAAWGYWPAAIGLFIFTWIELVMPERDDPLNVLFFVVTYSVVQIAGGVVFGSRWHERADAFEVYSSFLGRLSPFQRDEAGILRFGNPLRNLHGFPSDSSAVMVLYVLLGSTAFDGLTRTENWSTWTSPMEGFLLTVVGTCGLLASVAVVVLTFTAAGSQMRNYVVGKNVTTSTVVSAFAHSLVPVIVGYSVAHYFSLLLFQGQAGFLLANDPLANGWNLFGNGDAKIDYSVVSDSAIAIAQVGAIVSGHLVGVLVAHDRATALFRPMHIRTGQYGLMACMVLYTFAGIGLLLGA